MDRTELPMVYVNSVEKTLTLFSELNPVPVVPKGKSLGPDLLHHTTAILVSGSLNIDKENWYNILVYIFKVRYYLTSYKNCCKQFKNFNESFSDALKFVEQLR